ncbi:MAG: sedoheptulose-7-phosphate:D-glyceraldehyde-3- phosphate transaldolase [Chaenotheca gracillima]|nr:MAG: sedoheptulose-7-phosphate:D-glyceraldehyde-3- phosphate transaldolase [Chaenotheca gracillima]
MAPVAPEDRPECQGRPEVWANSRQALCESLPYYQSYQGGGYTYQNHCYGFLVDGHGHFRDMVNASVVITRAGGGLKRDISGKMVATREQHEESAQCKAVQKNIFHKKPVVMILGEGHSGAPCKPIAPYCILGWFKPTHVWIEKDEGHFFYKYRFEKYDLAESSWWVSKEQQPSLFGKDVLPAETSTCASCHRSSPKIYAETWICLNEHCQDFWKLGRGLKAEKLTYGRSFLRQSTSWLGWKVPHPVKLDFAFDEGKFYDTSIGSRKGFVCPQCSMCNSRTLWSRLVCTNAAGCSFRRNVPPKPVQPESLADPNRLIGNGHADPMNTMDKDKDSPVIERPPQPIRGYRVHTYDFAECGRLVHFISNKTINAIDGGANDMFREMQEVDVGLERRKMPSTKMKGDNYTNQFSLNFGVHYEYYVDVPTRSFEESCQAVRAARTLLNWAGNDVVRNSDDDSEHFKEFNELLALGYFEKQKMNYHDDGEHGLGPTIATLSLGYPASMSLRMKAKYYTGMSKTGSYVTKAPPVPGCLKYEQRKVAHARLDGVENATERQKIGEKIIRDLQLTTKKRTTCPPLVNLTLRHGDIVIMHGFNLQKYYEHAVESQETIRFALTCRYVDPFSLKPEHRPKPATATTTHRQGADSNITQQHSVVQTVTNSDNLAKDSETINSVSDTNADAPAMVPYTPNQPMSPTILSGSAGFTVSSGIVSPPDNTGMVPMELDHDSALPDSSNPLPALNMTDTTPMDLREDSSISHGQDNTETSGATSDPTTATELDLEIMSGSSQSSELSEIECPEDVDLSVLDPVN